MPTFDQLKLSAAARPLVDSLLARAATDADKAKVKDLLVKAAGVDGNKVLSANEVQQIVDSFQTAQAGGAQLTPQALGVGLDKGFTALKSMESLGNLDGITTDFTLEGKSVEEKLIAQLNQTVAKANGKPTEINMMIFEFQSDSIEKAITDIAKKNPNVTFRVIADSTQASDVGGNALPSILSQKLPNVEVKFKKDFPYTWSNTLGRPDYSHTVTNGLNHHKGFATFIDGVPDRLVTGSFNWSSTADTKNYEDLSTFENEDAASRRPIEQFGDEFAAYWNNSDAVLSPNDFANFKGTQWNAMLAAHGKATTAKVDRAPDNYPTYVPRKDTKSSDINSYSLTDKARLTTLLGSTVAKAVLAERAKSGRFASLDELKERVPQVAAIAADKLDALRFGSGKVSINDASLDELDQLGFTNKQATAIVAARAKNGDFESIDDLLKVPGVTQHYVDKVRDSLTATDVEVFFNSKPFSATTGGTGYGSGGKRTTEAIGSDGVIHDVAANVTVGATDLFNRAKPGQTISVAMYGMSPSAPEYKSLVDAVKRGVTVKVVLNDDFNDGTVAAIKALRDQGLPIDVRVQKAKTMHEKFAVVGDDVFSGSANFSESSSTKHSENRITVKNDAEISQGFQARFDELWNKSKPQ